jgi:ComF family protein
MNLAVNPNLSKRVDAILKAFSWGLLAPCCVMCHQPGMPRCDLCQGCFEALHVNQHACRRCAEPLALSAALCVGCQQHLPPFQAVVAPFIYQYPINVLIPRFKFHRDLAAGQVLADVFLKKVQNMDLPQALVPVPLHVSRLRERGFDQALELAKRFSHALKTPLLANALQRIRPTQAQSQLDAKARQKNCRDAFVVEAETLPAHIALVDDVMTTGATAAECANVLLKAGAQRVDVWVIARVAAKR